VVDWEGWDKALRQFAAATGLVVSAYDAQGERRLGPILSSPFAKLLDSAGLWRETGPGPRIERELAGASMRSGQVESSSFCEQLRVLALPLVQSGSSCGAVVMGWGFSTFASGMGCERIARQLGCPSAQLWSAARLESPVTETRMETYTGLLTTLIAATGRQADAIQRLNELSRMREVFLASVSHEMRTPLNAMALRIELLLRSELDDPDGLRAALNVLKGHVDQEAKLVEDMIDAARTQTGQLTIVPSRASLGRILRDALSTVALKAEAKKISIDMQRLDGADEIYVWGDAHRLQQLFWNLLFNAVKFTPSGGTIGVRVRPGTDWHEIEVRDSGRGISKQALPHLFDAFNKQQQDNEHGLGLGLFIAKHIAELHGGTISVTSPGNNLGAAFTVVLPAGPASADADLEATAPNGRHEPPELP
jgi:signal transduction histidine kinase